MGLRLHVEGGPTAGREYALESGGLEMGRAEDCDIVFDASLAGVSRHHASVRHEPTGYTLVDHSSNGTWVNGQRVQVALLFSGDIIRLGTDGPRMRVSVTKGQAGWQAHPPDGPGPKRRSLAEQGLYNPTNDKGRSGWLGIVVVLGMTGSGVCLGLFTALLLLFQLGPTAALIGVVVAFAAAPVYLLIWLWLDRYDPEPAWVLAAALVWGAGAATFVAGTLNSFFTAMLLSVTKDRAAAHLLSASLAAPVVEEALKGLAVVVLFLAIREEFDGILDGIVYSGVVALGFAAVENVLYYGSTAAREGLSGLAAIFFLRGVLGPFAHALFTSMTGIGCGIARQSHRPFVRLTMPLVGYAGAVTLHFMWNVLAAASKSFASFVVVYVIVWAPLFLIFFSVVIWMGFRERRLIRHMLDLEVARGLLTAEQADTVASWLQRMRFFFAALGDPARLSARRRFTYAATRLALSHWHVQRATAAGSETLSFSQIPLFQDEVARLREEL
jgi:protease PrsW